MNNTNYDLLINPEMVELMGQRSITLGEDLGYINTSFKNELNNLSNAWKGIDQSNFRTRFEGIIREMNVLTNAYKEFGELMESASKDFDQEDGQSARRLRDLCGYRYMKDPGGR